MVITLSDGTQQTIPDNAWALPFFGQQPSFQVDFLNTELAQFASINKAAADQTLRNYAQWKIVNTTNRNENLPATPKPTASQSIVFHHVTDKNNVLYFWQTGDGPPVVPYLCPDLDPLPDPAENKSPIIGNRIGDPTSPFFRYGMYFQAGKLVGTQDVFDVTPGGTQAHLTSADGVKGVYMKIASPFGGGYWYLLSQDPA